MSKLQKGILWGAVGITYVFAMNIVLAWATTGYLDGAILTRMAIMLLPVLAVAAVVFPYAGVSRAPAPKPAASEWPAAQAAPPALAGGAAQGRNAG